MFGLFSKRKKEKERRGMIRLFVTGFAMGSADLVPGVSGGTVAFIAGIYEELVYSIKLVSGRFITDIFRKGFSKALKEVPFKFLVPLFTGIFGAVLLLSSALSYMLEVYPIQLWSVFFGLIVASAWVVKKRVVSWDWWDIAGLVFAVGVMYWLVGTVPVETAATPLMFFLTGAVAICAMILPGVSGSFLLVVLGKYEQVLAAVVDRDIFVLVMVGLGAVIGLGLFSRLISWLFDRHHDLVVAILTGMMIGSLRKIWPWKEVVLTRVDSHGYVVPVLQRNIMPQLFSGEFIFALLLAVLSFGLVYWLDSQHVIEEQVEDVESREFEREHKEAVKEKNN